MIQTKVGLPNTCSNCGKVPEEGVWFADNPDAARSGQGVCADCAGKTAAPAAKSGDGAADDLTEIEGIGPKTVAKLNQLGINTFRELAESDTELLAAGIKVDMAVLLDWQSQAAEKVV